VVFRVEVYFQFFLLYSLRGHKKKGGKVRTDIDELVESIYASIPHEIEPEWIEDTYILESDLFCLCIVLEEESLQIRNIEIHTPGLGRVLLGAIHEYCDERELAVYASNVKDTAIGFWLKMGYTEGQTDQEFFRVA
jgi:hypothetical protein